MKAGYHIRGRLQQEKYPPGIVCTVILREEQSCSGPVNSRLPVCLQGMCIMPVPSQVALVVKNLPAMLETWAGSLGQEDSLEKEMATHSSILAWEILWAEEPGGL